MGSDGGAPPVDGLGQGNFGKYCSAYTYVTNPITPSDAKYSSIFERGYAVPTAVLIVDELEFDTFARCAHEAIAREEKEERIRTDRALELAFAIRSAVNVNVVAIN